MTNLVSCSWSCAFHIWPELRIAAGIEASMMTSLGTWRFVMPRLESTCASAGPRSYAAATASWTARRTSSGSLSTSDSTPPRPWFGSAPTLASSSAYCPNTSAK
jgi:hypothetical protein